MVNHTFTSNASRRYVLFGHTWSQALVVYCVAAFAFLPLLVACGNRSNSDACPPEQYRDQKGRCANAEVTTYVTCIDGQAQSTSEADKVKIEAGVDTALKVAHVNTVVEVARTISNTVDSQVALQIVNNCLELSKSSSKTSPSSREAIQNLQDELDNQLRQGCMGPNGRTPTITLSPSEGSQGSSVAVTGSDWPGNIKVEILVFTDKFQASTDAQGGFSKEVTIPTGLPGNSVDIHVSPVDNLMKGRCSAVVSPALFTFQR